MGTDPLFVSAVEFWKGDHGLLRSGAVVECRTGFVTKPDGRERRLSVHRLCRRYSVPGGFRMNVFLNGSYRHNRASNRGSGLEDST